MCNSLFRQWNESLILPGFCWSAIIWQRIFVHIFEFNVQISKAYVSRPKWKSRFRVWGNMNERLVKSVAFFFSTFHYQKPLDKKRRVNGMSEFESVVWFKLVVSLSHPKSEKLIRRLCKHPAIHETSAYLTNKHFNYSSKVSFGQNEQRAQIRSDWFT